VLGEPSRARRENKRDK
jgi:hypothetical protein